MKELRFQNRHCAVPFIWASSLLAQRCCGSNNSRRGLFNFVFSEVRDNAAHLGVIKNYLFHSPSTDGNKYE